jgi:hypothetical protein
MRREEKWGLILFIVLELESRSIKRGFNKKIYSIPGKNDSPLENQETLLQKNINDHTPSNIRF